MITRTSLADETRATAEAVHLKILGRGIAFTVNTIAEALLAQAIAERARIVAGLLEEADLTPCSEDAMVTRSNATLIRADFSYEEAERLTDEEEA